MTSQPAEHNNKYIARYLTEQKQSDNEIWSVNRIYQEKYVYSKVMHKMRKLD